jgi:hypothetical protein
MFAYRDGACGDRALAPTHARIASVDAIAELGVWHIEMPAPPSGYGVPFVQLPQEEREGAEHPNVLAARDEDPAS